MPKTGELERGSSRASTTERPTLGKSKSLALFLAFVLGPLSWLYTYERDKTKFWAGILVQWIVVLAFGGLSLSIMFELHNSGSGLSVGRFVEHAGGLLWGLGGAVAALLALPVGVLFDRLRQPTKWYERYPKLPLSKKLAIIFAGVFPQAAWLYTYEKDRRKFWFYLAAIFFLPAAAGIFELPSVAVVLASLGLWLWAIIVVASRKTVWYASYPDEAIDAI